MQRLLVALLGIVACTTRDPPVQPVRTVVFVCEHGAAKSVLAMAYFNKLATERGLVVRAIARGADPQPQLSTATVAGLRADGVTTGTDAPRQLAAADVRAAARVVAFDCTHPTMAALRGMDACWDDVPAAADDYSRARDVIRTHVTALLDELAVDETAVRRQPSPTQN